MIIAEISVVPVGTNSTSLSEYIAAAVSKIKEKNIKYKVSSMGTQVEVKDLEELFEVVKAAHEAVINKGADRVYTTVTIDDRRDVDKSLEERVDAVKEKLK
ncbi:protein of unknown function DUF77 [Methanothermus fervidus DSM 2088]|uniref:Thiamine-binding protein domain-containing protein n=1 Tax=Methanothermus fervidus (strain ATCC 43054 / DSM 2088 / JCM 10308 / V24 S) TaxID=523846 RepID=E3GWW0_METFV|nr:MTH1187 family thiamine-binding protein [Methanothermus fervidus]ADP78029.1 protein of unknown function DUF77 [Methanothermus fervidus DSM 2088]